MKAIVQGVAGATVYWEGPDAQVIPHPASVEIEAGDGGYYLFRLDSLGKCISDTWHESLERAKTQAHFEYGIGDKDWRVCE